MFTIRRNIILPFLAILTFMATLSSFLFSEISYTISFVTFLYLVFIPGFLVTSILRLRDLSIWDVILYSVGFSLFILMVPGVLFNWVWSLFSASPPLQTGLLATFFGVINIALVVIASFRCRDMEWSISLDWRDYVGKWYFVVPPILTVMSVFSAIVLNNEGSNLFAMIALSLLGLCILLTILFRDKLHSQFYEWSIYFHSLSLLLILSLRSNYVSGWDIQNEFGVFQLTKQLYKWSPLNLHDAYNACLSITVLPTIISRLTFFPDDYIYKILYQLLFALTPIIIYRTYKRYSENIIAFIAVIYMISQPLFIQPMTSLTRQEIAFIFFTLMMYLIYTPQIKGKMKYIIGIIFGTGMVVSHYSTTYIVLLLLASVYPLTGIYRLTEKVTFLAWIYEKIKLKRNNFSYEYYISPILILYLFLLTYFWFGFINNQLGQVKRVATEGIAKMNELFKSDIKSNESKKALSFLKTDYTTPQEIQQYTKEVLEKVDGDKPRLYPPESYKNTNVIPLTPQSVQPLFFSSANRYFIIFFEVLKQIFKMTVILGPLYIFVRYFRENEIPREYIVFTLISVLAIGLITFHPYLGLQYNLSRLYLQLLFYLALPAMLLSLFILFPLKKWSINIVGILVVILFIYLVGIPNQILGGESKMYLNNYGADYDKFYIHDVELASAKWLKENVNKRGTLFADTEANLRIYRHLSRSFNYNTLPALIYRDAYVYGSYANVVNGRTSIFNKGSYMLYSFPKSFLEENKDVIYSNGGSKIYK